MFGLSLGPNIEMLSFLCVCVYEIVLLLHFVFYYENSRIVLFGVEFRLVSL